MATRLELCTSASSASGATADEAAAEDDRAAERGGARRVDTRLELCTRGSSTIPSCAPDSARTTGTARRAREGKLSRTGKEGGGGSRASGGYRPAPRAERHRHEVDSTGIGRGDARRDEPSARVSGEGARGGKRARKRDGHRGRAHSRRRRVAEWPRPRRRASQSHGRYPLTSPRVGKIPEPRSRAVPPTRSNGSKLESLSNLTDSTGEPRLK